MLLSHFNRELDKTAIIFEFLGKRFRNLEKLFLDRTLPLYVDYDIDNDDDDSRICGPVLIFHSFFVQR